MSPPAEFTIDEANRRLPYIRVIVRDVVALAETLHERQECLNEIKRLHGGQTGPSSHTDEFEQIHDFIESHKERLADCEKELEEIQVQLVDCRTGLVELPSKMDGRSMWLNWIPEEPEIMYWRSNTDHPAKRRPLLAAVNENKSAFTHDFQDNN